MRTQAEIVDVAAALCKEAKQSTGRGPAFRIFRGWRLGLSYGPIPLPPRDVVNALKGPVATRVGAPKLGEASYEEIFAANAVKDVDRQWIFSASLHPRGRSSVENDWFFLGKMCAAIGAPINSCVTSVETTNPNDVHYWMWDE